MGRLCAAILLLMARPYAYSWRHHPPPAAWCTEAR